MELAQDCVGLGGRLSSTRTRRTNSPPPSPKQQLRHRHYVIHARVVREIRGFQGPPSLYTRRNPPPEKYHYLQGGPKGTPHLIFRGLLRVCSLAGKIHWAINSRYFLTDQMGRDFWPTIKQ